MKTKDLSFIALFAALIAAGAFIRVPIPVVPFTLQFLFTTLAGLLLGGRKGAVSVIVYIAIGLAGLPIFSEGGGIFYVFNPTFGYLIGFAAGAYVTGKITESAAAPSLKRILVGCFAGLMIVYAFGMIYYWAICKFYVNSPIGVGALFLYCFVLAVPGDIFLCFLSATLAKRLYPVLYKDGKGAVK